MHHKIDYYAFTIPVRSPYSETEENYDIFARKVFTSITAIHQIEETFSSGWELEKGTGFYKARLRHEKSGVALSFGTINPHIYVELSGKSCDCLSELNALAPLISETGERASRIDFAVDIVTDEMPAVFSAFRNETRWKHLSTINSATGQTCYVGSRKGERMARVYRYASPHPRSHLLRVEAEYKGDAARAACAELQTRSLEQVCLAAHVAFGWSSHVWLSAEETAVKIPYSSHNPTNAATVLWIYNVVAASLRNAVVNGLIDWREFEKRVLGDDTEQ